MDKMKASPVLMMRVYPKPLQMARDGPHGPGSSVSSMKTKTVRAGRLRSGRIGSGGGVGWGGEGEGNGGRVERRLRGYDDEQRSSSSSRPHRGRRTYKTAEHAPLMAKRICLRLETNREQCDGLPFGNGATEALEPRAEKRSSSSRREEAQRREGKQASNQRVRDRDTRGSKGDDDDQEAEGGGGEDAFVEQD
ncbi:hypothetical protein AXG93_412s1380 [Marchantia polymorpha subsp. ruderalis]|uniref:Uncharacterized protein n=1 Tax=Marchantia polymorpha subsp. ruderalis TaxID=1480154 RepID=A0A176VMV0_MARPO|nr:hypothetical protein AXG93_412s1380 [Marchantia polymorpha subsp. ruderalis]